MVACMPSSLTRMRISVGDRYRMVPSRVVPSFMVTVSAKEERPSAPMPSATMSVESAFMVKMIPRRESEARAATPQALSRAGQE